MFCLSTILESKEELCQLFFWYKLDHIVEKIEYGKPNSKLTTLIIIVNLDIFACIHFRECEKISNFAWIV